MSTVVWDGKTLAADTAITYDGTKTRYSRKLRVLPGNGIAGWVGDASTGLRLLDWLESGCKGRPRLKDEADVIHILPDRSIVTYNQLLVRIEIDEPIAALGSGANLALGALLAGVDARRAVEIAISRDTESGFEVVWTTL